MRYTLLYAAIAALCLLPGCKREPDVIPLGSHLRLLKVGDKWSYKMKLWVHAPDGILDKPNLVPKIVYGTADESVAEAKYMDHYDMCLVDRIRIDEPELAGEGMIYVSQNPASRDIVALGDNGGRSRALRRLEPPVTILPGRWRQGMVFTVDRSSDDGDKVHATYTVLGTDVVKTAIGAFKTWKIGVVADGVHDDCTSHSESTQWWAPQLGNTVKEEAQVSFSTGLSGGLTTEIVSTTAPSSEYSDSSLVR